MKVSLLAQPTLERGLTCRHQRQASQLKPPAIPHCLAMHRETSPAFTERLLSPPKTILPLYEAMVWGWLRLLEMRDAETEGHSERVTTLTLHLANYFGLSANERDMVRWGALLHDIGKMGVPDSILLKPSALTADEWKVMKMHPVYAYEMLSSIPLLQSATHIPYCHHEKWDGSGYPRGLQAEEIPFSARIFAVIDVWDALCSERPYRAAWSPERAMGFIYSESGMHFDPMVVAGFMECYTQDPTAFRSRH